MHNKFGQDKWKNVHVISPTRWNYWRTMWEIAINLPFWFFLQPLLNLSGNWSFVTCVTNWGSRNNFFFKSSRPQGQIIEVECKKSAISIFFSHYRTLSETCVLVTCITNLGRRYEKPSRPLVWRARPISFMAGSRPRFLVTWLSCLCYWGRWIIFWVKS